MGSEDSHCRAQKRSLYLLPLARLLPVKQRGERAKRGEHCGRVVDIRCSGFRRSSGNAGHVHGPRHCLSDTIEPASIAVWPRVPERRLRCEDDVRSNRAERRIVEPKRAEHRGRQVGNDDIGGRNEPAHDLTRLRVAKVEGKGALVARCLKEHGALTLRRDRRNEPILPPAPALDAVAREFFTSHEYTAAEARLAEAMV